MRPCKTTRRVYNKRADGLPPYKDETKSGLFHQWGTETLENEHGNLVFTIGIVEFSDGKVATFAPEQITFTDHNPFGGYND